MTTIYGTVIATPTTGTTKGNDKKPAAQVRNLKLFEKVPTGKGKDAKFVNGDRVIEVGHFNFPADMVLGQGDLVRVSCGGIKSAPWARNGKSGMNHKATTNGAGMVLLARKGEKARPANETAPEAAAA